MGESRPDPNRRSVPAYEQPDNERPASAAPTEADLERETPSVRALDYSPPPLAHDPYLALRFPEYLRFSVGWIFAVVGHYMVSTAIGWEIIQRTKSTLDLGYVAGVQALPLIFLALPAGLLADRMDRRRLSAFTSILAGVCSAGLGLCSYRPGLLGWMYVLIMFNSAALILGRPARAALLPRLVPTEAFTNALTWNSTIFQVASMSGPALAGLVIAISLKHFHSVKLAYFIDAASQVVYAAFIMTLPARGYLSEEPAEELAKDRPPTWSSLWDGVRFVSRTKLLLAAMTLDLFAVLLGGAVYLLPVFATDILHVGSVGFGWLRAAEAIGAFIMALFIAHMPPMQRAGRSLLLAVAGFGICTLVFGLSRNFWLSFAALCCLGACDNVSVVVRHTLVQILTPDVMRGRVSAVNQVFIGASNELGGLESGLTAAAFSALATFFGATAARANVLGPVWSVLFGGTGTLVVVAIVAAVWPQVLALGTLQDLKPVEPPAEETRPVAVGPAGS